MTAHVKQLSIIFRRFLYVSGFLVGFLYLFHLTFALCLISAMQGEPQQESPL